MADETTTADTTQSEQADQTDESKNTDASQTTIKDVPYSRFKEINDEKKSLEQSNADLQKQFNELKSQFSAQTEEKLKEQGKYQELYEEASKKLADAESKALLVEEYDKVIGDLLDAQVQAIPEHMRKLVPSTLPKVQQLDWIRENLAVLQKPQAQDIGADEGNSFAPDQTAVKVPGGFAEFAGETGLTPEQTKRAAERYAKKEKQKAKK